MKDVEKNINHQVDTDLEIETGLETILEIVLEIHKIEIEWYQEDPMSIETRLETIQLIDNMIGQEMVEMTLNRHPRSTVNIVIKMVILGNIAGRCKPMQRKQ